MSYRLGTVVALWLVVPALAVAQDAPERLLPATTQFYLRWDGVEAHRAAYEKTALGKMMQEDTGKFFAGLFNVGKENAGALLTVPLLQQGLPPEKLQKAMANATEAGKLLTTLGKYGIIVGLEVRSLEPPQGQVTVVFPSDQAGPFTSLMKVWVDLAQLEVKETKIDGKTIHSVEEADKASMVWWIDGKNAVLVLGTDKPADVVKNATAKTDRLTDNEQYKKLAAFKDYETSTRGFVDIAAFVKLAKTRGKEAAKIIDDLGLDGFKGIRFQTGFDGPAQRSLVEVEMPAPRKGLLRLAASKPFKLADLPPIAPDATDFSASRFDVVSFYDVGVQTVQGIAAVAAPDQLPMIKEALKKADEALGLDIRKDLLAQFDDMLVVYSSPGEGPLGLGQTYLIRVKDGKKVEAALEKIFQSIGNLTGTPIEVKKKTYHGVAVHEIHVASPSLYVPTYAIHNGWLAISYFPQPVQGFILRSKGELPKWEPSAEHKAAFAKLPSEMTSLTVSDPRPWVKLILSWAPLAAGAVQNFVPESKFEASTVPNAHEATRHLFPNVTVATDDGTTLRVQTRSSLTLMDALLLFVPSPLGEK